MALTITKAKAKEVPAAQVEQQVHTPDTLTDEQLADAYGQLEDQINALMTNPVFNQFELVKKELMERIAKQVPPEDGAAVQGEHWLLEIGACSKNPRKIKDVSKIQAFVGLETFAQIAKVNISDCEKYLTPDQLKQVVADGEGYGKARKITAKYLG